MPIFLVSFPSKDEQDIRAVHKTLFAELENQSQPPVVGTQRYVEHQFSSFAQEPLDALAPRLISLGLGPCRIESAQIQDAIGLVHTTYSLFAEDHVTLLLESMTARVLEVARVATNDTEVEYDGWVVSYETLEERG
jgi:hypothetical protein